MPLQIIHTCDLHGRLNAPLVSQLQSLRSICPGSLLLDCGDALGIGNLNPGCGAGHTLATMTALSYSAMAMGNRETHLWWPMIRRKLAGADFPVLSANLRGAAEPQGASHDSDRVPGRCHIQRWAFFEPFSGFRVAVFGLTPAMVRPRMPVSRIASIVFDDPLQAGIDAAQALTPRSDLLICLSHLGTRFDHELARAAPAIHVILGGHDHSPGLPTGEWVGCTLLARSDPHGASCGEVWIELGQLAKRGTRRWAHALLHKAAD